MTLQYSWLSATRCSRRIAQPFRASTMISQAIKKAVKPIVRVNRNIAFRSLSSIMCTMSLVLAMNSRPPAIKQKDEIKSEGGRDAKTELGGQMKVMR